MEIKKSKRRIKTIPMSSLADVAFLLLIFLIVTSAIDPNNAIDIAVPKTEYVDKLQDEKTLELLIDKNGNIYYEGKIRNSEELKILTLRQFYKDPQTIFFIKGDKSTAFKHINILFELLKENKIQNVVLTAERLGRKNKWRIKYFVYYYYL